MRSAKAVVTENAAAAMRVQAHGAPARTITSLRRWSIANRELPGKLALREIHYCANGVPLPNQRYPISDLFTSTTLIIPVRITRGAGERQRQINVVQCS